MQRTNDRSKMIDAAFMEGGEKHVMEKYGSGNGAVQRKHRVEVLKKIKTLGKVPTSIDTKRIADEEHCTRTYVESVYKSMVRLGWKPEGFTRNTFRLSEFNSKNFK